MRGKALDRPPYVSTERITPAHAGKSATSRRSLRASGDHPRACGEKIDGDIRLVQMRGSPPRVRGKAIAPPTQQTRRRITPACAGKSKGMDARARQLQDHPRVCGEKSAAPAFSISVRGSPPRVRGKVRDADDPAPAERITPACAGKSADGAIETQQAGDHPRVCGEKSAMPMILHPRRGSPPRVRGKAVGGAGRRCAEGITPACAGKSGCG